MNSKHSLPEKTKEKSREKKEEKTPLDELTYEFLLFLEESTRSNTTWMGFDGLYYYEAIVNALIKKLYSRRNIGLGPIIPDSVYYKYTQYCKKKEKENGENSITI